jgi:hypothetical protein
MLRFATALLIALAAGEARAADADAPLPPQKSEPKGPLFHPDGPGRLRWRAGAGFHLDILPRKVVESEQRPFPLVTLAARVGLPKGFSVDARAAFIYVANYVELGGAWSYRVSRFSFGLQHHTGIWFGALGFAGYDAFAWSVLMEPGVSFGLDVLNSRFTLVGEALLDFAQHTTLGSTYKATGKGSQFAGIGTTLVAESFFGSFSELYYGVGLVWALPDYTAWIAFSDSRTRVVYPRLLAGYAF